MAEELTHAFAPFTPDQVESLNAYQTSGAWHPFTCANRTDTPHQDRAGADVGQLVAFPAGWRCPDCDYTQSWAWTWMANWGWKELVGLQPG